MDSLADLAIRKFNPGVLQSDDDLIRQFVVRQDELDDVLEVMRDNIGAPSCQHLLVVAPRGRGKTMLLARVAAELRTNAAYSKRLMPVRIMEESHEVSSIGDFWLEILFYLAKECAPAAPDLAKELEGAHADLSSAWQDRDYADRVRATVLTAADQLGKQLVLMVENLQDLCDDVDKNFGWQLRESLQMEPGVMLLATATSRFKALDDAKEPFFELFMMIDLAPLGTDECKLLWEAVAGESIMRHEVRPLEILTGGSPRLLTIVAGIARHQSVRQLMEDLVALVDDHTDYFRGHLEVLPKTERRVYVAAISLWRPSASSEIADRARVDIRIASSMLGRLVDRGALVVTGGKRKRKYAAAERLYCFYYKIRRERDETAVVQMLMRFMAIFYSKAHRSDIIAKLVTEIRHDPMIHKGMIHALQGDPAILKLAPEAAIAACDQEMRNRHTEPLMIARLMLGKGVALHHLGKYEAAIEVDQDIIDRFIETDAPQLQDAVAMAHFNKGQAMYKMGNADGAIAIYDDIVATHGNDSNMLDVVLATIIERASVHVQLGRHRQEALDRLTDIARRYDRDDRPFLAKHVAMALLNKGSLLAIVPGCRKRGLSTWRGLIDRFGGSDDPLVRSFVAMAYSKIAALHTTHGLAEEAVAACEEATAYAEEGVAAEEEALAADILYVKGSAQRRLGRTGEALESHAELANRFGDIVGRGGLIWHWHAAWQRVFTYYVAGMADDGRKALRALYAMLDPEHAVALSDLQRLVVRLAASGVPSDMLADELDADPDKAQALWPLMVALRRRAGQSVRAPVEVMEVADDVLREIERLAVELASPQPAELAEGQPAP